ncbi:UDP-N-acetylmuramate--L-alanine ligase [Pelistega suis]|uniref:UDP-N-acetylmuramate--L-alanine ligase n=1 Tax=Pelistega suis TaxID=1631957 RepID=UPI00211C710F|nr:UDP-N-acetylmuramate--L-alanine ligase [Pelistega suis]MCQ9329615.1 UDP-N-acetylmuramate--L-alanine ligase [Pelistega suis]
MKHKIRHIHFVGIGGSGMSGIAEVLLNLGYHISGSDMSDTAVTRRLASLGAKIFTQHLGSNVEGADAIVTSTAILGSNPEVLAARAKGIPVVPRAIMLAELMRLKSGIAIAGTHGKTTTTSLVASILGEAGMDPTFVIGGKLNSAGANARLGTGDFIVVEADESDASFLNLLPTIAVITNIDEDHMDTYGHNSARLLGAFVQFLQRLPFYGSAVVCTDDENVRKILPLISCQITSYGFNEKADFRAVNVRAEGTQMHFDVKRRLHNKSLEDLSITLNTPGKHNVLNALAAIAVATEVGASDAAIVHALAGFNGVGRRFTQVGDFAVSAENGGGHFKLIDDYGHHPVEMAATIEAARGAYPNNRLVLAFQPHRYTRTRDCFDEFVRVLGTADAVLLTDVYPAGEAAIPGADGLALTEALQSNSQVNSLFIKDVADLPQAILDFVKDGDIIVCMGAGSINKVPTLIGEVS